MANIWKDLGEKLNKGLNRLILEGGTKDPKSEKKEAKTGNPVSGKSAESVPAELPFHRVAYMVEQAFERTISTENQMKNIMYFPMCVFIDLCDEDFLRLRETFPYIAMELCVELPRLVSEGQKKSGKILKIPVKYWHFQFRSPEHCKDEKNTEVPTLGKPIIRTKPFGPSRPSYDMNDTEESNTNVRKTVAMAQENFVDIGMWDDARTFTPLFIPYLPQSGSSAKEPKDNPKGSTTPQPPQSPQPSRTSGVLAVLQEGNNRFEMREHRIEITGKTDSRNLPNTVWRLDVALETNPYLIIVYKPENEGKTDANGRKLPVFEFATYGKISSNRRKGDIVVNELSKGGNMQYYSLPSGAELVIPAPERDVRIVFRANR
ncbi:MAG: hypothetical protein LBN29_09960 [Mediterranea sp.]|jgi:hypothetical protein|nr:hypothetical protein [Mediterranea sp.]